MEQGPVRDRRAYMTTWRDENRERINANSRAYYRLNKERIAEKAREYLANNRELVKERKRRYRLRHREKVSRAFSRWHLLSNYGISPERWEQIKAAQGQKCAACGKEKKLMVDHCHKTGLVRGGLCRTCNMALGHAQDDPSVLDGLAAYLRRTHGK
jgi:hypothetical protein